MIVAEFERALLARYPKADAEGWDHVGLSVGDPAAEITGVACALDATEANVRRAQEAGANVLLTHHPIYIKAPEAFCPADAARPQCSAALYEAARCGVSIISLHTNLDRSHEARVCLSELLGAAPVSSLEHVDDPESTGLGALATLNNPCSLRDLAARAATAFGSDPRVWGEAEHACRTVAILGGSLGDFGELAIAAGADVVVTGEAGYHVAQDLALRGLSVILLGHDRSEEPFVDILMNSAVDAGVDEMTKLYAQRKDLDIELDDLNTTEIQTNNAIEAAKKRHVDGSDYREVQDLENELATLAKRLDKIEHTRKDVVVAHKEALEREARAQAIIAKFEEGVKADTKAARAKAADLQAQIDAATKERTALAATLPADVLTDYERLLKQFRGLAVETIQGNIPTVCHTALQASSMSDLNHDGSEITHCPYCHRLLVLPSKEA